MNSVEDKGWTEAYLKTGKRVWSYRCSGPANKRFSPLAYYRRQLWSAWNAGFTGAGLNLTLPNVVGYENLLAGIADVWASPFTARASNISEYGACS